MENNGIQILRISLLGLLNDESQD